MACECNPSAEGRSEMTHPGRVLVPTLLTLLLLAGCAAEPQVPAGTPVAVDEGMGMGEEIDSGMVAPGELVASSSNATIAVSATQDSGKGVEVDRVVAPVDSWLVVQSAAPSRTVLGKLWVPKGESSGVVVSVEHADSARARVALHADRGVRRRFEYIPSWPGPQQDSPIRADRIAVARSVYLSRYGAEIEANSALILVEDQALADGELRIDYLIVPYPSWVSVHEVRDGVVGRIVGIRSMAAGEWQKVDVPMEADISGECLVLVHDDRQAPGRFDYRVDAPLEGADRPYVSAGVTVGRRVALMNAKP